MINIWQIKQFLFLFLKILISELFGNIYVVLQEFPVIKVDFFTRTLNLLLESYLFSALEINSKIN